MNKHEKVSRVNFSQVGGYFDLVHPHTFVTCIVFICDHYIKGKVRKIFDGFVIVVMDMFEVSAFRSIGKRRAMFVILES